MKKILMLLDASGSMNGRKQTTISGVNEYMQEFKNDEDIMFELVIWNSHIYKTVYNGLTKNFQGVSEDEYDCGFLTPLIDVFGKGLAGLDKNYARSVLVVVTDGEENCSTEYNFTQVKSMLEEFRKNGNEVMFLGAGIDSWASQKLAIDLGTQSHLTRTYNFGEEKAVYNFVSHDTRKALDNDQ